MSDENKKDQENVKPVIDTAVEKQGTTTNVPDAEEIEKSPWGERVRRPKRSVAEDSEEPEPEQTTLPGFEQPKEVLSAETVLKALSPIIDKIWSIFDEQIKFYFSEDFKPLTDKGSNLAHAVYIQNLVIGDLKTLFNRKNFYDVAGSVDQHVNGLAAFFRLDEKMTLRVKKMKLDGTHSSNNTQQARDFDNQDPLDRLPADWARDTHINIGHVLKNDEKTLSHIIIACPRRFRKAPEWYVAYRGSEQSQEGGQGGQNTTSENKADAIAATEHQLIHLLLPSDKKSQ